MPGESQPLVIELPQISSAEHLKNALITMIDRGDGVYEVGGDDHPGDRRHFVVACRITRGSKSANVE